MRIITANVNGIRSAAKKGFFDWLPQQNADVVCLQETKAQTHQLADPVFWPEGYFGQFYDAERKGYSGVAIYSRQEPDDVIAGFGVEEFDREGRYLEVRLGRLSVVSLYLPSGSASPERQASKDRFLDAFPEMLREMRASGREYILCGDWNIAHKAIDLKNWRGNQKNSGFLPHERAWLDRLVEEFGFVDAFRRVNDEPEQYTWWSNRGQAWAKNVGWRIDYQFITPGLADTVRGASIWKDNRFSDHAPLILDYEIPTPCALQP
ncbi:MAG: exodeoxyribonuclease III [Halothiobacillaceae bacterium]|jgi:exodeoxyribonuclease-3|nr:exodeoxyribonuclease III [Halothiobacillaceae bacterium]